MAVFEISNRTSLATATALAPLATFRAGAQRARIREIGIFTNTAPTTPVGGLGLMRSTAIAVTPAGGATPVSREPGDAASTANIYTTWATAPTVGVVGTVFRRLTFPLSVGQPLIWTWDVIDPLVVPIGTAATGEIVLVNLNATAPGTLEIYVSYEE